MDLKLLEKMRMMEQSYPDTIMIHETDRLYLREMNWFILSSGIQILYLKRWLSEME